jgi:hypothetical protein
MRIRFRYLALLAIALTACQRAPQTTELPAAPAGAPAPAAQGPTRPGPDAPANLPDMAQPKRDTTPVDAHIVNVRLSKQGDTEQNTLGAPAASFAPTDTVFAEVETSSTAGAYTLYAKWLAPDGTVLSDYGMHINEAGPKRTVISLSKPDGWAPGQGRIELAINGKTERTVPFPVQ